MQAGDKTQNFRTQMRKGILEYCILLAIGDGEVYSSDLLEELKRADLLVVEGTLYPLLSRLRANGLVSYTWQESDKGPPRKYYRLTAEGEEALRELDLAWSMLAESVNALRGVHAEDDQHVVAGR